MVFRHGIGLDQPENAFHLEMLHVSKFASLADEVSPDILVRSAKALTSILHGRTWQARIAPLRSYLRAIERTTRHMVKGRKKDFKSKKLQHLSPGRIRVAVLMSGGLGDMLQRLPYLIRFFETFTPEAMDLYLPRNRLGDTAEIVVSAAPFFRKVADGQMLYRRAVLAEYDLVIEIRHLLKYHVLNRWLTMGVSPLADTLELAARRLAPFEIVYDQVPRLDGFFGRAMASKGMNVTEACGYLGGLDVSRYSAPPLKISFDMQQALRKRFEFYSRPYITLHEGFAVDTELKYGRTRATRCWPMEHWVELVRRLKVARPDVPIVQIGTVRSMEPIAGVDHVLLDEVSLFEASAIIAGGSLHFDSETGMVSVAWCHQRPTISIQGPTASEYYQIGEARSFYWKGCSGCWWARDDWMSRCVRGLEAPECMYSVNPADIEEEALKLLDVYIPVG